jgi:hypothetical protein
MFANVVEQVAGPEGVFDGFRVKVGAIGGCEFTMTVTLDGARPFAVWGVLAPSLDALLQVGHGSPTARIGILLESEPNDANSITLDPVQVDPIFGNRPYTWIGSYSTPTGAPYQRAAAPAGQGQVALLRAPLTAAGGLPEDQYLHDTQGRRIGEPGACRLNLTRPDASTAIARNANARRRDHGFQTVPRVPDRRAVEDAVPRRGLQLHQHAHFTNTPTAPIRARASRTCS